MNERDRGAGRAARRLCALLIVTIGSALAPGGPLAAQDTSAVPIRVALVHGSLAQTGLFASTRPSTQTVAAFDESAGRTCRASLQDDSTMARTAVALTLVLPDLPWNAVQIMRLPADVAPTTHAALETVGEDDPMIYWRPPLRTSELLHELVHAWQAALPDDAFASLLERLDERDARAEFSADVVARATSSVVRSLTLSGAHGSSRMQQLVDRVLVVKANEAGTLSRRADSLVAVVSGPEWSDTRRELARGLSTRPASTDPGRTWAGWLRALLLTEAQAYDAQARCENGVHVRDWLPDAAPTAIHALAASPRPADSGAMDPRRLGLGSHSLGAPR